MSFREKSAWISLVCLLLLTVAYFVGMHHHPPDAAGHDLIDPLHAALFVFGAFALLQVVLHLIAWLIKLGTEVTLYRRGS